MSKSLYKRFKTDANLEKGKGLRLEIEDSAFILKRAGGSNTAYKDAFREKITRKRRALTNGAISDKEATAMLIEVYADTVIIGWENVTDEDGKKLPFNRANAIRLFSDLPDLFDIIVSEASNYNNFLVEAVEEAAKN